MPGVRRAPSPLSLTRPSFIYAVVATMTASSSATSVFPRAEVCVTTADTTNGLRRIHASGRSPTRSVFVATVASSFVVRKGHPISRRRSSFFPSVVDRSPSALASAPAPHYRGCVADHYWEGGGSAFLGRSCFARRTQPTTNRSVHLFQRTATRTTLRAIMTSGDGSDESNKSDDNVAAENIPSSPPSSSEIEIECKFPINGSNDEGIEQILTSLEFQTSSSNRVEFVDWYFDLAEPTFTLQDVWMRYREKKIRLGTGKISGWKGAWQVKKSRAPGGANNDDEQRQQQQVRNGGGASDEEDDDGMTVYEELQGKEAVQFIWQLIRRRQRTKEQEEKGAEPKKKLEPRGMQPSLSWASFEGNDIPHLPSDAASDIVGENTNPLLPFARFETRRTSWRIPPEEGDLSVSSFPPPIDDDFRGLSVDIDRTDFGYAVGEVESVLMEEDSGQDGKINGCCEDLTAAAATRVRREKKRIRRLVSILNGASSSSPAEGNNDSAGASIVAMGKLEHYLATNRPEHYAACIEVGVIRPREKGDDENH